MGLTASTGPRETTNLLVPKLRGTSGWSYLYAGLVAPHLQCLSFSPPFGHEPLSTGRLLSQGGPGELKMEGNNWVSPVCMRCGVTHFAWAPGRKRGLGLSCTRLTNHRPEVPSHRDTDPHGGEASLEHSIAETGSSRGLQRDCDSYSGHFALHMQTDKALLARSCVFAFFVHLFSSS